MSAAVSATSTSTPSAPATITALLGLAVGGWLSPSGGCPFFVLFFAIESFFTLFAVLVFKLHLDAMVKVRFLQHLAAFAGGNLRMQLVLLLVICQIVFIGLVVMMRSVVLFALNHLFLNQPTARRER